MLNVKESAVSKIALNQGVKPLIVRLLGDELTDILFALVCILLPYYDISTLNVTHKLQQGYL